MCDEFLDFENGTSSAEIVTWGAALGLLLIVALLGLLGALFSAYFKFEIGVWIGSGTIALAAALAIRVYLEWQAAIQASQIEAQGE